jgi:signal transduction histidine kinase
MGESNDLPDSSLRRAYGQYLSDLWVRRTKVLCWIAIAVIPTGVVLDRSIYRQHLDSFLIVRVVTEVLLGILLILLSKPSARQHPKRLGFAWMALPIGQISVMIGLADGIVSPYYIANVLVIMGACLLMPWTFKECLGACSMTWGLYAAACLGSWLTHGPPGQPNWIPVAVNNAFFMLIFPVIGLASSHVAEGFRFREFGLRFDLDRKKKELEVSNQKLADMDRAKSQFFANISHELRTPLTLILSPLDQLRSSLPAHTSPKFQETLDIMHGNALQLLALINDLLDLVRLDERSLALALRPVDLKELLPGLVGSMQGAAERANLKIETHFAEAPALIVPADKNRIEKVFINLLFNAIKFTPAGGTIQVRGRQENGAVLIDIQDSGIGIAEEKLGLLFGRFWQEDGSSTRNRHGTGIGLALVKELVELHGGAVTVQSKKGIGSTFTVRLPLYQGSALPVAADKEEEEAWLAELYRKAQHHQEDLRPVPSGRLEAEPRDRLKHTLLLVEDEPAMQRFLTLELKESYKVVVAADGQAGYEMAQEHQPKLIVTDMMLPKMDGITLCRKLKSSPTLLPTKIVLLTARADDRTKLAALEAGADDFLTKPFSTVELKTRLGNLLLTAQLERELHTQNQVLETTLKQLRAAEAQLIQTERLSALGSLSAGIMHEINNPVNFMVTATHYLRSVVPNPSADAKEALDDIEGGLKRVRDIIADLKSFAYGGTAKGMEECDPQKILRTTKRLLAEEIKKDVSLEEKVGSGAFVYGNQNQLVQLLVNLIQNALQATADNAQRNKGRNIKVRLEPEGDHFVLSVRDNGIGIPKENLSKLFDPFFTTKPVGEGMGLGLSISHTIVKQHHGEISVNSEPGEFAEFVVRLPLRQPEPEASAEDR